MELRWRRLPSGPAFGTPVPAAVCLGPHRAHLSWLSAGKSQVPGGLGFPLCSQTLNPAVPGGRGLDRAVFSVRTQRLLPSRAKQPSAFPSCWILRNSNTWLRFGEARLKSGWLHKGWLSFPGKQGGVHLLAEKVKGSPCEVLYLCVCGISLSCRGRGVFLGEVMSTPHPRLKKAVRGPSLPLSSSWGPWPALTLPEAAL